MKDLDFFIFAGEASADKLGGFLIQQMKKQQPFLKIAAVAGKEMRKENPLLVLKMEEFAVMGFFQVFLSLFSLIKKFFFLKRWILKNNPKVLVFIDYPGFTLRLEKSLKKKGYKGKIIHWVCPTVWAWGKKRISLMEKNLDLLLVLFPFEEKLFFNRKLKVQYVGHPLASITANVREKREGKFAIGLFPGSREKEIEKNLPFHLDVIKRLIEEGRDLNIYISVSHENFFSLIQRKVQKFFPLQRVYFWQEDPYAMMEKIDIAIATSGTINLELALHLIPTVVTYYINPLETFFAKNILKILLPYYCIVNICEEKQVFFELYGPNLTKEKLYFFTKELLCKKKLRESCKEKCEYFKKRLYKKDPCDLAAQSILSFLSF